SASVRGIYNLFRNIYGKNIENAAQPAKELDYLDFYKRSQDYNMSLPKISFFIQNKSRSLDKKATKAFNANIDKIAEIAGKAKELFPHLFANQVDIVQNIKDGNTLASIINHNGLPLSKVQATKYTIYETVTQADQGQIDRLLKDVQHCVGLI
ncbi:MAG: ParA family protein, partial [Alphaproteobacteria bacterium]|nr:ParA family protein [Alphaproteobacteria bacterium]